jgi:gas vesicle protein
MVTVVGDPRLGDRKEVILAQRALSDRLRKSSDKLIDGMDRLTEAEDLTKKMEAQLKDMTGKEADTLRKAGKQIQEEIKSIREFINGKTIERQGYGRPQQPPTPMSVLQQANRYISAKPVKPGAQEEQLVKDAELKLGEAVEKINNFFTGKWAAYRKLVETNPLKLFKDYQLIQ